MKKKLKKKSRSMRTMMIEEAKKLLPPELKYAAVITMT